METVGERLRLGFWSSGNNMIGLHSFDFVFNDFYKRIVCIILFVNLKMNLRFFYI